MSTGPNIPSHSNSPNLAPGRVEIISNTDRGIVKGYVLDIRSVADLKEAFEAHGYTIAEDGYIESPGGADGEKAYTELWKEIVGEEGQPESRMVHVVSSTRSGVEPGDFLREISVVVAELDVQIGEKGGIWSY